MNSAGSTLMFPDRDREYEDYQESLDEPDLPHYDWRAFEKEQARHRLWEDLGPQATVDDWVQACKEQGL